MKLKTEHLSSLLLDLETRIREGDSFEGNIQYTCMAEGLERDEWEVTGAYRIGNSQGQGGMRIL